jgi:hypothetical protein
VWRQHGAGVRHRRLPKVGPGRTATAAAAAAAAAATTSTANATGVGVQWVQRVQWLAPAPASVGAQHHGVRYCQRAGRRKHGEASETRDIPSTVAAAVAAGAGVGAGGGADAARADGRSWEARYGLHVRPTHALRRVPLRLRLCQLGLPPHRQREQVFLGLQPHGQRVVRFLGQEEGGGGTPPPHNTAPPENVTQLTRPLKPPLNTTPAKTAAPSRHTPCARKRT